MAVPFYLPEGGTDDTVSSASGGSSSDGASTSSGSSSSSIIISSQLSPNTTATSATQTPTQSPLLQGEQLVLAFCEAFYRCSMNTGSPIFQYPPPPSPSCSMHSPTYSGGDVFFPRGRSTPRTPRTSVSSAVGEEPNYFHHHTNNCSGSGGGAAQAGLQQQIPPQSAPLISSHHLSQTQLQTPYHHYSSQYQYTPPPTPTATTLNMGCNSNGSIFGASSATCTNTSTVGATSMSNGTTVCWHRTHSDAIRRSRLTSTGEDEREVMSEHETSWNEFGDRFENFTAGREHLQEFNGRIPPRKKTKEVAKLKPEKKQPNFTWPTVVTVFVFAMGCGFLVAR